MQQFCSEDVAVTGVERSGPSRNASAISLATPGNDGNGGTSFDDPDNSRSWSFRPVDDLGLVSGVSYGVVLLLEARQGWIRKRLSP